MNLVEQARQAADNNELHKWLLDLLKKTEASNPELIRFIVKKQFELKGPRLVSLDLIQRTLGPEKNMLNAESEELFKQRVETISKAIKEGYKPAPLLAEFNSQNYVLLDGNHAIEALKANDYQKYWVIYYDGNEISQMK